MPILLPRAKLGPPWSRTSRGPSTTMVSRRGSTLPKARKATPWGWGGGRGGVGGDAGPTAQAPLDQQAGEEELVGPGGEGGRCGIGGGGVTADGDGDGDARARLVALRLLGSALVDLPVHAQGAVVVL